MTPKRIYISGQITSLLPDFARQRFLEAAMRITQEGHIPVNPMELPHKHDGTWESYMREDIAMLMTCQEIYMLSGWGASNGARVELYIAEVLRMPVRYQINELVKKR